LLELLHGFHHIGCRALDVVGRRGADSAVDF
jgi:hypothetical protein